MTNVDPQFFRWLLVLNLTISGYHRTRARSEETIPRSAKSLPIRLLRVALALPALMLMPAFVIHPPWTDWSSLAIPVWSR